MSKVGYARVSTLGQDLNTQLQQLKANQVDKIYQEKISASTAERPQLQQMLDYIREDDQVVVTKIDRLARSTQDLLGIVEQVKAKGASLQILNINLDTGTPTGELMLTMLGAIAQFERQLMLERQSEGIKRAKNAGKYKGRKPTARAKSVEVLALANQGKKRQAIADELDIGIASVFRILAAAKK